MTDGLFLRNASLCQFSNVFDLTTFCKKPLNLSYHEPTGHFHARQLSTLHLQRTASVEREYGVCVLNNIST